MEGLPFKRQRRASKAPRPEQQAAGSAPGVYSDGAHLYDEQQSRTGIQRDMASLAVALLGQADDPCRMLADIGCGSGLSCAALAAVPAAAWVGTDVTGEMLRLAAARQPGCRGRLAQSDFCQGLPLRAGSLDGAISVSAVQWLCAAPDPPAAVSRFFAALWRSLAPGGVAAMQVYPEDDEQAQQLVAGARECGLAAAFCVSFPHATPAKKYYLLAQRLDGQQQQGSAHLLAPCCNLAWPKTGSCILSWARHLQQQRPQQQQPEGLQTSLARMQQEHAAVGLGLLRLLRRAESLAGGQASGSNTEAVNAAAGGGGADGSSSEGPAVLQAELEVAQLGLMPCGGAIFVQLTTTAELLCTAGCDTSGGMVAATAVTLEAPGMQQQVPGVLAAVQQLLLGRRAATGSGSGSSDCSSGSSSRGCQTLRAALKAAKPADAQLHARLPPLAPFQPPPPGAAGKAFQFMRLEPLLAQAGAAAAEQAEAGALRRPVAAVLHVAKTAQHLALRFSCGVGPCAVCSSSGSGGGTCGSTACVAHMARCMRHFCAAAGACVVSVDAHLRPDRLGATWLLWVGGLQALNRGQLSATLQRHFA